MAASWFKFGAKKNKTHANGVTIKDEIAADSVAMRNSKSVNFPPELEEKKEDNSKPPKLAANGITVKSLSVNDDAIDDRYGLNSLEEALHELADNSQPVVARSTPKGIPIDTSHFCKMKHCLYEEPVYDAMLKDSMHKMELLQHNLDDFIVEVRRSPAREIVEENSDRLVLNDGEKAK